MRLPLSYCTDSSVGIPLCRFYCFIVQIPSRAFHRSIVRIPLYGGFHRSIVLTPLFCGFHYANSINRADSIVRLSLCGFIPSCGFHCSIVRISSFHCALIIVRIPSCGFHHVDSLVWIPSYGFHCVDSIVRVSSCGFHREDSIPLCGFLPADLSCEFLCANSSMQIPL